MNEAKLAPKMTWIESPDYVFKTALSIHLFKYLEPR